MASGDTLLVFDPSVNVPPAANAATFDTRNQHLVLDHDDTVNESCVFPALMPRNYAGGGITVYLHFSMSSAATGDVDLDVAFERIGDGQQNLDSDGFAAVQSSDNVTVPATSGLVGITSIAFTDGAQIDGILAGESFRLKVTRDAVSDTAVGDLELLKVELRET